MSVKPIAQSLKIFSKLSSLQFNPLGLQIHDQFFHKRNDVKRSLFEILQTSSGAPC